MSGMYVLYILYTPLGVEVYVWLSCGTKLAESDTATVQPDEYSSYISL